MPSVFVKVIYVYSFYMSIIYANGLFMAVSGYADGLWEIIGAVRR